MHDVRFVEDNWESPTLGAWGLGWEVWLNGMEVTQFTYFQQVGGLDCKPVTGEITYGLERLAMYLQGVESIFDIVWTDGPLGRVTYRDVFHQNEVEQSTYNFEHADTAVLLRHFDEHEAACGKLLEAKLALPAYEQVMKASHTFNLLDARKAISVTERQRYILRVRTLARAVAQAYYDSREALGFPMLAAQTMSAGSSERRRAIFSSSWAPKSCRRSRCPSSSARSPPASAPGLAEAGLPHGELRSFATPRRLAVLVRDLAGDAAGASHQAQGSAGQRRLRQGRQAHRGRHQVRREVRRRRRARSRASPRARASSCSSRARSPASLPSSLLPGIVQRSLDALPIPKRMRWGASSAEFVRPVHWLVMLFGADVVPARILDTDAGTRDARPPLHGAAGAARSRSPRTTRRRCASRAR